MMNSQQTDDIVSTPSQFTAGLDKPPQDSLREIEPLTDVLSHIPTKVSTQVIFLQ